MWVTHAPAQVSFLLGLCHFSHSSSFDVRMHCLLGYTTHLYPTFAKMGLVSYVDIRHNFKQICIEMLYLETLFYDMCMQ